MPASSQLEMVRPHLNDLPPPVLSPGSALRTFQPGDEVHWARIMNDCIGQDWTPARCLAELVQREEFRADGCFFSTVGGIPQGTATAYRRPELGDETGYVHMVGVAPEYRGRGLGRLVTLATLHWFAEHGFRRAFLHTDDWRLPAIGCYLKLGFEPVMHEDQLKRWQEVLAALQPASTAPGRGEGPRASDA